MSGNSNATCQFSIDSDFLKTLSRLENSEKIMKEILEESAPILVEEEKKRIVNIKSGALKKSIKATNVKQGKYGDSYIVIRPTGKDKNGVRNMEKFVYLEYGTSNQKANPIQQKVISVTSDEIDKIAEKVMRRYVDGKQ